ncbi:multicomponent Na+:H+ antiporter subunit C [Trueperella bonasi]|uniref:Multicomponent Na+:H+ antiporter subunit C n=1 Tax=Trueperella bonasi TaxID=312286 RepID=A0ABT9NI75_9ACTO|nr:Na(+)/H(+) antiporter subunit C [Trueperella bonasi]MDP9806508.1 multicomponent Na+:H+ antiporter subunit C [Trueperella bonasi]
MTSSFALALLAGGLVAVGIYLVLERSFSRIILGMSAITNGVNILFLIAGGPSGEPPLVGAAEKEDMSDPLVQAMMLTAIVIGLATTAFMLAMAYRSWQLNGNDEVQDDLEDRRIAKREGEEEFDARADGATDLATDSVEAHDETEGEFEDHELAGTIDPVHDRPRNREETK